MFIAGLLLYNCSCKYAKDECIYEKMTKEQYEEFLGRNGLTEETIEAEAEKFGQTPDEFLDMLLRLDSVNENCPI